MELSQAALVLLEVGLLSEASGGQVGQSCTPSPQQLPLWQISHLVLYRKRHVQRPKVGQTGLKSGSLLP